MGDVDFNRQVGRRVAVGIKVVVAERFQGVLNPVTFIRLQPSLLGLLAEGRRTQALNVDVELDRKSVV